MTASPAFERDRLTWLAYWMLGYGAYTVGLIGPLMPFLREERQLSFTLGGLLTAMLAVGTVLSGLASNWVLETWGRRRTLWLAALGAAAAAVGVALARPVPLLFVFALLLGMGCSLTLTAVQATLADRHGERRAVALSESNVVASLVTIGGPLAIGGLERAGIGWRGALFLPAIGLVLLAALYYRERPPEVARRPAGTPRASQALSAAFWAFWVVVVLVVSIEWCLLVWGADYLETVVGLSKLNASTAMSVYLLAILAGRVAGSRLALRMPGATLLLLTLAVTAVGFPIFWLARWPLLNLAGLFITGLGVASLFPFTLAVALGLAPRQANAASARVSLGVGVAILGAPLVLGWAADNLGLPLAYGLVLVLIATAMVVTALARRVAARPPVPQPL